MNNEKLLEDLLYKKSLALCVFVEMLRPSGAVLLLKKNLYFFLTLNYVDMCLLEFKMDGQANDEVFYI